MTVNLSALLYSALILLTYSLEEMSLSKILVACQGHVVWWFVAVVGFFWGWKFVGFDLGGLPHFLLTWVLSNDFISKDSILDGNMYVWCNWAWNAVKSSME